VRNEERQGYEELFNLAWPNEGVSDDVFNSTLEGGFFGVENHDSGLLVSSCIAGRTGLWKAHPETGSLGWLVTDPAHSGRGLATTLVTAVMNRLNAEGYEDVYLSTEDERLTAIHIYLKLGWEPLLYSVGMEDRWRRIRQQIHL
jgi:ribosomal protein S18 acetylase RimI-like enzyme